MADEESVAISLLLCAPLPYDYSAGSRQADPLDEAALVRRIAEARGWPEPMAARFIKALQRLLHTIDSE